jgi:hypothetical protein
MASFFCGCVCKNVAEWLGSGVNCESVVLEVFFCGLMFGRACERVIDEGDAPMANVLI